MAVKRPLANYSGKIKELSNSDILPLDSAISDIEMSGFIEFTGAGDYYSMTAGGTFTILLPGRGRLSGVEITWAGGEHVHLSANKAYYIGYTATDTLSAIDASTIYNADIYTYYENFHNALLTTVFLYSIWYDGLEWIITKQTHPYEYMTDIAAHDHFRLGSVFIGTGAVIEMLDAANRTIKLVGADCIDDHGVMGKVPDSGGLAISTIGIWKNGSNVAQRYFRRNFTVSGVTTAPTAGATYTNNGSTFTVLYTNAGKTLIEAWISTKVAEPEASGVLTKVSGTGDATITFSAVTTNRVVPCAYISGGVPTPLGTTGATRFGISAIYALIDDLQTPTTVDPVPVYMALLSNTTYTSNSAAALSLGTGAGPIMSQFVMPGEIFALEPVLLGFVICDGSDRSIEAYTGNGFVNGVRSYKATPTASFSAGAVAVAAAVNVSVDSSAFDGVLTAAETDTQKALDRIDDYAQPKLTYGIADTNSLRVDDASAADNDYAKFTASGLEGRSYSEVLSDIGAAPLASPTFTGEVTMPASVVLPTNGQILLTVPTSDGHATGNITNAFNSGYSSSAIGDLVYLDSSATWQKCDMDTSAATYSGLIGIALEVKASGNALKVALPGSFVYCTAFPTLTIGSPVYMSDAGAITHTQPSGADDAIRMIGWAVHADKIYFFPSPDYMTHT